MPIAEADTLSLQPSRLLGAVVGHRLATGADHSPPGKTNAVGEDVADGPRRPRKSSPRGDVAVADHLAALQIPYNPGDGEHERTGRVLFGGDRPRLAAWRQTVRTEFEEAIGRKLRPAHRMGRQPVEEPG